MRLFSLICLFGLAIVLIFSAKSTIVLAKAPRVMTSTKTPTASKTGTRTQTATSTATLTLTPSQTLTSTKTFTRTKSPTRTSRPSNTPIVLRYDFEVRSGVTGLFKPFDGDICWGELVGNISNVVVEFTQNYVRGIAISGGGCITDGSITSTQLRSLLRTMGRDYSIQTLPIWIPTKSPTSTETFTPTVTSSKTATFTATNTPTQTRTATLSPTITVIKELPIDWETTSGVIQPYPGTICAGEQVGAFNYEVVEFLDDYGEISLVNGWCYIGGEVTALDILNYLQRQGLPYTRTRILP